MMAPDSRFAQHLSKNEPSSEEMGACEDQCEEESEVVTCHDCQADFRVKVDQPRIICPGCGRVLRDMELSMEEVELMQRILDIVCENPVAKDKLRWRVTNRLAPRDIQALTGQPVEEDLSKVKPVVDRVIFYMKTHGWVKSGPEMVGKDGYPTLIHTVRGRYFQAGESSNDVEDGEEGPSGHERAEELRESWADLPEDERRSKWLSVAFLAALALLGAFALFSVLYLSFH